MTPSEQQPNDLFEDRKKAAENKYRLEQAIAFRVTARAAKLFGLWAAEKMGLGADEAALYAAEVVGDATGPAGAMEKRLTGDLSAKGIALDQSEYRSRLIRFETEAREQILDDIAQGRLKLS